MQFDTVKWDGVKNQNLNIKITPDMVPSARLVVYYVLYGEEKAELVADSTWIDVKAKCVNNLNVMPFSLPSVIVKCFIMILKHCEIMTHLNIFQVDISTPNSQHVYKPKDELKLRVSTKSREESLVVFSAVDTALYNLKSYDKDPLKKVK